MAERSGSTYVPGDVVQVNNAGPMWSSWIDSIGPGEVGLVVEVGPVDGDGLQNVTIDFAGRVRWAVNADLRMLAESRVYNPASSDKI